MDPDGTAIARRIAPCLVPLLWIACGDGASPTETEGPPEPPAATLVGRAVGPGGAAPAQARATATWPSVEAAANLATDGSFELDLSDLPTGQGTLVIETLGDNPAHHPAWIRLDAEDLDREVRVVLVPRSWRVREGEHADVDVAISPAAAAEPRLLTTYWGFTFAFEQHPDGSQTVLDPTRWTAALRTWDPAAFPVPLAVDRARSTRAATSADSALLWDHVAALEEALGRDLFRPAPIDAVDVDEEPHTGAVLVRLADTIAPRGVTETGLVSDWFLSQDASAWSGTEVTELTAAGGEITGGAVHIRDDEALTDRALVVHELMHALGVGHGCSWRSVQTLCGELEAPLPTAEDVAYLELLEAMRTAERQLDTPHGILAGVFGERVVGLGLTPVPSADLVGAGPPP